MLKNPKFFRVSLTRRAGEEVSHEVHFHVLDTAVSAEKYANLARGHWEIENSMKGKSIKKKMIDYMIDLDLFNRLIYEIVPNRT